MLGGAPTAHEVLPECMVRRRVASEKRRMAVGLRQCIRPSVESVTPGHDGYPLAFVLINWTASKLDGLEETFSDFGFRKRGRDSLPSLFSASRPGRNSFLSTGVLSCHRKNRCAIAFVLAQ